VRQHDESAQHPSFVVFETRIERGCFGLGGRRQLEVEKEATAVTERGGRAGSVRQQFGVNGGDAVEIMVYGFKGWGRASMITSIIEGSDGDDDELRCQL
jgi:hypothetical protein